MHLLFSVRQQSGESTETMSAPHSPKAADKATASGEVTTSPVTIPTGDEVQEKLATVEEEDEPQQLQIDTNQSAAVR